MPPDAIADAETSAPVSRAARRPDPQLSSAAALTSDLIRRAKTPLKAGADMALVRLERDPPPAAAPKRDPRPAPVAEPAPAVPAMLATQASRAAPVVKPTAVAAPEPAAKPTASAAPPPPAVDSAKPGLDDFVAAREEALSVSRSLRRNMGHQPVRGRFARAVGLFAVIYAISCVIMIYVFI